MATAWQRSVACLFRGNEHELRVRVSPRMLDIAIEDVTTTEQWTGSFEPVYIEQLTQKTGSYKSFPVFCAMLDRAIQRPANARFSSTASNTPPQQQSLSSVNLDFLTYADLAALHVQKTGGAVAQAPAEGQANNTRRYLIVTYISEFDKVHYPLPLVYGGQPDPTLLVQKIRRLQHELGQYEERQRSAVSSVHADSKRLQTLQSENAALRDENGMLAEQVRVLSERVAKMESQPRDMLSRSTRQLDSLRAVVGKMEQEMMQQKTKYQKLLQRRDDRIRDLEAEVESLQASEQALKLRCRNMSGELASRTRQPRARRSSPSLSARHSTSQGRDPDGNRRAGLRSRSASPATGKRFDPTAYVRAREEKLETIRRRRQAESRPTAASSGARRPPSASPSVRTSSSERRRPAAAARTSTGFAASAGVASPSATSSRPGRPALRNRSASPLGPPRRMRSRSASVDEISRRGKSSAPHKAGTSTSNTRNRRPSHSRHPLDHDRLADTSTETAAQPQTPNYDEHISDLDARLKALQKYLSQPI